MSLALVHTTLCFILGFLSCLFKPKGKISREKAPHRLWLLRLPHAGRNFLPMLPSSSFLRGPMCAIFLQALTPHLLRGVEEDMNLAEHEQNLRMLRGI